MPGFHCPERDLVLSGATRDLDQMIVATDEQTTDATYDVVVVGAGPAGLVLALDLGQRGVQVLLVEKDPDTKLLPKMDRSNARTMEIFRRLGVVDQVRAVGYPPDASMDVLIVTTLAQPPLTVLEYPTVAEHRAVIRDVRDGSEPLEPYQLVSQNDLEPVLTAAVRGLPGVTVRFGCELIDFDQDDAGVRVALRGSDGRTTEARASYLVACDGGTSPVRKQLGIPLSGRGGIIEQTQITFRSEHLYERLPFGKGRHYYLADEAGSSFVVQGSRTQFTLNLRADDDINARSAVADRIGFDVDFEIQNVRRWKLHLLLADRYRDGRVFLAGDAAHLVIPTGGLGMNTAVGDAVDLGWKLAGTVHGWGGPGLLDSYEVERRAVGAANVRASGWAAEGMFLWRNEWKPEISEDSARGEAVRAALAAAADRHQRRVHEMIGTELGYSYAGSDLVAFEPNNDAVWDPVTYTPHARPGVRVPHVWLRDGRALQDVVGRDYTLLDVTGRADTSRLTQAFDDVGAPLVVVSLDEPEARAVLGAGLLLLRPDLHVFWRGDQLPDVEQLAKAATGHGTGVFGCPVVERLAAQ